ncbi:MAG: hypothetical protein LBC77_04590 [Spirochaetaceae bacterium]|nr:hypothetical protein [Spirochaetaceae bacterium]
MKKFTAVFAAFVLSASAVFALDIPIIAGVGLDIDLNITTYEAKHRFLTGLDGTVSYTILNGGGFFFFDVHYLSADIGFSGLYNFVLGNDELSKYSGGIDRYDATLSGGTVNFSLLGKYPFEFDGYYIYPILGIEGRLCISMRYTEDSIYDQKKKGDSYQGDATDWSAFWFRVGAGADFYLSDSLFIRTQLTFGIKLNTARENTILKRLVSTGVDLNGSDFKEASAFGAGGKLTVAIGYNFGTANIGTFGGGGGGSRSRGGGGGGRGKGGPDVYLPFQN